MHGIARPALDVVWLCVYWMIYKALAKPTDWEWVDLVGRRWVGGKPQEVSTRGLYVVLKLKEQLASLFFVC